MLSLLAMLRAAERRPDALGLKMTVKVVEPAGATGLEGWRLTVKSAAFVPETATMGDPDNVRLASPVLRIVIVCETVPPATGALPKSVQSVMEGVVSPSTIETLFP